MYQILDARRMMRVRAFQTRRRKKSPKGFNSSILLAPGTNVKMLDQIPDGSMLQRTIEGFWEAHVNVDSKENLKKIAKAVDAIAYL